MDTTQYDAMIFLGDYAYEFYQNNGQQGDAYVNRISPLSFRYPLAMTPGNHEDNLNFTLFNEKFRLPAYSSDNLNNYNSFDIGTELQRITLWMGGEEGEERNFYLFDLLITFYNLWRVGNYYLIIWFCFADENRYDSLCPCELAFLQQHWRQQ